MKSKIVFVVLLVIAFGLYCGLWLPHIVKGDNEYNGTITLNEKEYQDFKYALSEYETNWKSMSMINHDYPTVINFNVYVPQEYNFPYGEITSTWKSSLVASLIVVFFALFVEYVMFGGSKIKKGIKWNWLFTKDEVINNTLIK